jgi:hypothetical protein
MRRLSIISSLLFFLSPLVHAQDGLYLSLEGDLRHFDYREYDSQGNLLDWENGFLPGLLLGMDYSKGSWQIAGLLSYHSGDIAYTGQTSGGMPISTTTRQQITDAELHAGYQFQQIQQITPTLYVGTANHYWRRDIQATHTSSGIPVRGLLETYRWWQAFLGVKISGKTSSFDWGLDTRLTRIIAPTVDVDYSGLYDNSHLELGKRWGFRLALPMSYLMNHSTTLVLEPYLERFSLGRSSTVPLTSQGVIRGTVSEPDSTTSNYGVVLGIQKFY